MSRVSLLSVSFPREEKRVHLQFPSPIAVDLLILNLRMTILLQNEDDWKWLLQIKTLLFTSLKMMLKFLSKMYFRCFSPAKIMMSMTVLAFLTLCWESIVVTSVGFGCDTGCDTRSWWEKEWEWKDVVFSLRMTKVFIIYLMKNVLSLSSASRCSLRVTSLESIYLRHKNTETFAKVQER